MAAEVMFLECNFKDSVSSLSKTYFSFLLVGIWDFVYEKTYILNMKY